MEEDLSAGNFWIVSDNHFGHYRLHKQFCPERSKLSISKGFKTFDEYQVHIWNKRITYDDIVVNLGDFFINKRNPDLTIQNVTQIIPRLLFKKMYLFKGNHDAVNYSKYDKRIQMIDFSAVVEILGKRCLFSHYPHYLGMFDPKERYQKEIQELDRIYKKEKCCIHYHGHIHGHKIDPPNINVSVDNLLEFGPVHFSSIAK